MIAHDEELANRYAPARRIIQRRRGLALVYVRLGQLDSIHKDRIVVDLNEIAANADHALDEWDVLTVLRVALGRLKDDDVAALVVAPERRDLVHEHVLAGLEGVLHRDLHDLVRLGDEMLNQEEDKDGQKNRLHDL